MDILSKLDRLRPGSILLYSTAIVCIVGFFDLMVGRQLSMAIFYVIPIAISSWYCSRNSGFALSLAAVLWWLLSDLLNDYPYTHLIIPFWNGLSRLGLFLLISYLSSAFRERLKLEELLAATDSLTGAANSRAFSEHLIQEYNRSCRFGHPFSVCYLDVDNFKQINDTLGHESGDSLLKLVVSIITRNTRNIDTTARLGGDELAVLLVETGYEEAAAAIAKIRHSLQEAMQREGWAATFSMGMVTFIEPPQSVQQIITYADSLMYSVKRSGKNNLVHVSWHGEQ